MRVLVLSCLLAVSAVACDTAPAPDPGEAPPSRLLAPAVAPAVAPGANRSAPAATAAIHGAVQEKLDAGGYSYLRIKTNTGDVWAAVPVASVAVGAEVDVAGQMTMANFESKTLNRTFASVVFGTLGGAPATAAAAPMAMPAATAPTAPVKVDKATGPDARTVAEVWAQKATIKDAQVTVRGAVVKYNGGIMGKNWLHIKDGTGTPGKDDDLAVTTTDVVAVGDVVTVQGPVRTDKDFGAGYTYGVIVEDAKVTK